MPLRKPRSLPYYKKTAGMAQRKRPPKEAELLSRKAIGLRRKIARRSKRTGEPEGIIKAKIRRETEKKLEREAMAFAKFIEGTDISKGIPIEHHKRVISWISRLIELNETIYLIEPSRMKTPEEIKNFNQKMSELRELRRMHMGIVKGEEEKLKLGRG